MLAKSVQKHAGRAKEKVSWSRDANCNAHARWEGHETHPRTMHHPQSPLTETFQPEPCPCPSYPAGSPPLAPFPGQISSVSNKFLADAV